MSGVDPRGSYVARASQKLPDPVRREPFWTPSSSTMKLKLRHLGGIEQAIAFLEIRSDGAIPGAAPAWRQ